MYFIDECSEELTGLTSVTALHSSLDCWFQQSRCSSILLRCALSLAVQCIVIGPVCTINLAAQCVVIGPLCGFVCVCVCGPVTMIT